MRTVRPFVLDEISLSEIDELENGDQEEALKMISAKVLFYFFVDLLRFFILFYFYFIKYIRLSFHLI